MDLESTGVVCLPGKIFAEFNLIIKTLQSDEPTGDKTTGGKTKLGEQSKVNAIGLNSAFHKVVERNKRESTTTTTIRSAKNQFEEIKTSGCNKHNKWHVRPAHVLTGETPVPRDGMFIGFSRTADFS